MTFPMTPEDRQAIDVEFDRYISRQIYGLYFLGDYCDTTPVIGVEHVEYILQKINSQMPRKVVEISYEHVSKHFITSVACKMLCDEIVNGFGGVFRKFDYFQLPYVGEPLDRSTCESLVRLSRCTSVSCWGVVLDADAAETYGEQFPFSDRYPLGTREMSSEGRVLRSFVRPDATEMRRLLALHCFSATSVNRKFVESDGDHAVSVRVLRFLL